MMEKLTNPRKYDRRIIIQHFTTVGVDGEGIAVKDWVSLMPLWAKRKPLTTRWREYFQAAGMNAEKMFQFEIRYREGITEEMRIIDGKKKVGDVEIDRIFDIKAVLDDALGDRLETWIMALELTAG